jgi:parallel beta-helix repeat protein
MIIANNTVTNTLGAAIVLGDSLEGVIENNIMTNAGAGILISAFGPYGGPAAYGPVMNTDVLRNTIAVGAGNFIWHSVNTNVAGIGVQDLPGCLESGLLIRNNVVSSIDTIYNTNGLNGVNANIVEQNQAYWNPTFPDPQFLIQANSPPPF